MKSAKEQLAILTRGVVDTVTEQDLLKKLEKGKPLNIKYGIDPTSPDIHIGHTVALIKLRQFQDLGHKAILIIGDYTAMIGDPSGRMSERPQLTIDDIKKNVENYKEQALKILDEKNLEIVYNGDWFSKMNFGDVTKLISKFTLAQMMEHDYFDKRFKEGVPLSLHELMYPIMQGYDSVMIKADIELGGTDQRFNVIAGRHLQKESGQEPQVGLFTPILLGLDGKNKMSKSLGNYIGINDSPEDMFGKVMSITDDMMKEYFELLTEESIESIKSMMDDVKADKVNPKEIKVKLASAVVAKYCGQEKVEQAVEHFENLFKKKEVPYEENTKEWVEILGDEESVSPSKFIVATGSVGSASEAVRIVKQGGFMVNEEKWSDFKKPIEKKDGPFKYKVGKRNYGLVRV